MDSAVSSGGNNQHLVRESTFISETHSRLLKAHLYNYQSVRKKFKFQAIKIQHPSHNADQTGLEYLFIEFLG